MSMTEICRFSGIIVRMSVDEHNYPHVHAECRGSEAVFDFNGNIAIGGLKSKAAIRLVRQWILLRSSDLKMAWEQARKGEDIDTIAAFPPVHQQLFFNLLLVAALAIVIMQSDIYIAPCYIPRAVEALSLSIVGLISVHMIWRAMRPMVVVQSGEVALSGVVLPFKALISICDALHPCRLSSQSAWRLSALLMMFTLILGISSYSPFRIPPVVIDAMDNSSGWHTYFADQGASMGSLETTEGLNKQAIKIPFSIQRDKWVGISKGIHPGLLAGTKSIIFSYRGTGAPNSIEVKLSISCEESRREAIFGFLRNHISNTQHWTIMEVPVEDFVYWPQTGCGPIPLDMGAVNKIDFAISNKPGQGDIPGSGVVMIDTVRAVKCRQRAKN